MKYYISVPVKGRGESYVGYWRDIIGRYLRSFDPKPEFINFAELVDMAYNPSLANFGKLVCKMAEADKAIFCGDWFKDDRCHFEYRIANAYGKPTHNPNFDGWGFETYEQWKEKHEND